MCVWRGVGGGAHQFRSPSLHAVGMARGKQFTLITHYAGLGKPQPRPGPAIHIFIGGDKSLAGPKDGGHWAISLGWQLPPRFQEPIL